MKPKIWSVALLALGLAGVFGLAACGGGGGGGTVTPPPHNGLTVLPGTASVPAGGTAQFSAFVNDAPVNATWTASSGTITTAGVFTAPASGTVTITGTSGNNSGTATVNIVAATALSVTPAAVALPSGKVFTFTAISGGAQVPAAWTATATGGGFAGTIDNNGNYTPPIAPPPGGTVTITASNGGNTATANVQVIYGNGSLPAQTTYAFAYTGDDGTGYLSVAGSFGVDGNGTVTGGVEDGIDLNGNFAQTTINGGGTYTVGPDGRGNVVVNTSQGSGVQFQFALAAPDANGFAHGVLIRFDNNATGSGTIDEQNPADFNLGSLTGPYVFSTSGADANFHPLAIAGKFWTNTTGFFPQAATTAILDWNDGGTSTSGGADTSLTGALSLDPTNLAFGRGFFVFSSGTTGQIKYAFYIVDRTHLKVVEIDTTDFTNGDIYSGLAIPPNGFQTGSLTKGNYAFTTGGTSTNGAYVAGGVFTSDGKGNVSNGIFDNNDDGNSMRTADSITSCPYTIDSATGRIAATLSVTSGNCNQPSQFAVYQTAANSAVMLELDSNPVSSGLAFFQSTVASPPAGSYAFNITGQGFFKNQPSSFQQDASGQVNLTGTAFGSGTIDLNNFGSTNTFVVNTTSSTFAAPDATFGRGQIKMVLNASSSPTYNLFYYMIDPNTMLLLDHDSNRIANGIIARQF